MDTNPIPREPKQPNFLQISLKALPFKAADSTYNHLASVVRFPGPAGVSSYSSSTGNAFVGQTASVSFPGNSDCGSYGMVRRFLDMGSAVPAEAVKIEQMLNYFNFYYEDPPKGDIFQCSSDLLSCPWNTAHRLLLLNICARKSDLQKAPPANLVFLIDASGSMDMPNKLPLVKSGLRLLIKNLRDIDTVSIVEYGGNTGVVLAGAGGLEKGRITRATEELSPDGPTPGEEGIMLAYQVAQRQFIPNGNNRIILVTDGDLCEGISAERQLEEFVGQQNETGIHLSCMGVGMSSFKDSQLPVLAQRGHGNFGYIDDEEDAEKLLANEFAPALCTAAENVYITADFDSVLVKEYRLIGFANKTNVLNDTAFRLQGRLVGSGHALLALFELVPKKDSAEIKTVAGIKISYCLPGQSVRKIMNYDCPNNPVIFDRAGASQRKAACIALFAMKLQGSGFATQISWMDLEKMAKKNFAGNDFVDKEYMALVTKARKIYEHHRVQN